MQAEKPPGARSVVAKVLDISHDFQRSHEQTALALPTRAARTLVHALFVYSGGLRAEYNLSNATCFETHERIDAVLNSSTSRSSLLEMTPLGVNSSVNVRWSGFVKPSPNVTYTFFAAPTHVNDRLKLWIDHQLLVDQWSSLQSVVGSGTLHFEHDNGYYEVKLEYSQPQNHTRWGAQLSWLRSGWTQRQLVSSQHLSSGRHLSASPLLLLTLPNVPSTSSIAAGDGLTIASSGAVSAFTISSKDAYGNAADFETEWPTQRFIPHLSCNTTATPLMPHRAAIEDGTKERITYLTSYYPGPCMLSVLLDSKHHVSGSPWPLKIVFGTVSPVQSTIVGSISKTMTAGVPLQVPIVAKDKYGAVKPADETSFIAAFYYTPHEPSAYQPAGMLPLHTFSSRSTEDLKYEMQALVTRSGNYSVHLGSYAMKGTGMAAQYYRLPTLDIILDEDHVGASPIFSGSPLQDHPIQLQGQPFSVRWKGFIRLPAGTGTRQYTMHLQLNGAQDRVRLWIDSALVIDQWTSLTSTLASSGPATVFPHELDPFRHLQVEYSHPWGDAGLLLRLSMHGSYVFDVPNYNLYAGPEHVSNSPFKWTVLPAPARALAPSGHGISLGTVGQMAQFRLAAKDEYGNLRDRWDDQIVVKLGTSNETGPRHSQPITTDSRSGPNHDVSYRAPTSAGYHYMYAFVPNSGGISATYYSDSNFSALDPVSAMIEPHIDFSGTANSVHLPFLATNSSPHWGVRWAGFIRPSLAQTYTLFTHVSEADERVKLWVDNLLLINQWASLAGTVVSGTIDFPVANGTFYHLIMKYKQLSGLQHGVTLKWSSLNLASEPITKMWWDGGVLGSPFRIAVLTGGSAGDDLDTSLSIRGFVGNTVNATFNAGDELLYRLQTQDSFGNDISLDCDQYPSGFCAQIPFDIFLDKSSQPSAQIENNEEQARPDRHFEIGFAFYRFALTVSGTYDLQVHLMRQNAAYMRSFHSHAGSLDIVSSFKSVRVSTVNESCASPTNFHFRGFIFVKQTGLVMFQLKATILAQFYIEGQLVTQFAAGWEARSEGNITLSANRPYAFSLQNQACSADAIPAEILWKMLPDEPYVHIPPSNLFYMASGLAKTRFSVTIKPVQFCSSCSTAAGHGLTLSIASVHSSFMIFARDQFCNAIIDQHESFVVRLLNGSKTLPVAVSWKGEGSYLVRYVANYSDGLYDLEVAHEGSGGVFSQSSLRIEGAVKHFEAYSELSTLHLPTKYLSVSGGSAITAVGTGFNTSSQVYECLFTYGQDFVVALPVTSINSTVNTAGPKLYLILT